jgi:hypothetical protein
MINGGRTDTNTSWLITRYEQGSAVMSPSGELSLSEAITLMHDYYVYEFSHGGKVFYVGQTYHHVRSHGRWGHVINLVKHERNGSLKPDKKKDLDRKSNRVIAALIAAGLQEHLVSVCRPCLEEQAEFEEREQILYRLSEGCILANDKDNHKPATVDQVLRYLSVATTI